MRQDIVNVRTKFPVVAKRLVNNVIKKHQNSVIHAIAAQQDKLRLKQVVKYVKDALHGSQSGMYAMTENEVSLFIYSTTVCPNLPIRTASFVRMVPFNHHSSLHWSRRL
jgi:hypothetical protein